jgi:hypothetical protein
MGAVVGPDGCGEVGECLRAADGIMAEVLDAEQAPVARKPICRNAARLVSHLANTRLIWSSLVEAADGEIVAHDLLEKDPVRHRPVQHLGHENSVCGSTAHIAPSDLIVWGERIRQDGQPLAQQRLDALRAQTVTDRLQRGHVIAGGKAVGSPSWPVNSANICWVRSSLRWRLASLRRSETGNPGGQSL